MATWAPPLDPAAFVYTPGSPTQFSDLAADSLAGVGDSSDTYEGAFLEFLSILPAVGDGIPGLDDDLSAFELALADFNTDEFSPILADLINIGPGVDAAFFGLALLDDFGSSPLGTIMPWLNLLAGDLFNVEWLTTELYAVVRSIYSAVQWLLNEIAWILGGLGYGGTGAPDIYAPPY